MPATKVQLTGGQFQDSEGNTLALGYLKMKLAMDGNISGVGNIASGIVITIQLDANGSVVASPAQSVWGVDQMTPPNNYYRVTGFTAAGQPAWGPNNQQVVGSGGTFDVGTWVPNQVISWTPPLQPLELDTNGSLNRNQGRLNFQDSASVEWSVDSNGNLTASTAAGLELQTNSVDNSSQTKLNLEDTASVTWAATAGGVVKATAVIPPIPAGAPAVRFSVPNFVSGTQIVDSPPSTVGMGTGSIGSATRTMELPTSTIPGFMKGVSPASSSNTVVFGGTSVLLAHGMYKSIKLSVATYNNTNCRHWICPISDATVNIANLGNLNFDAPTQQLAGFRFSTAAGDTHWQAVCNNVSGAQTLVDTGVSIDTTGAFHVFETRIAQGVPGTIKFYIDGNLVATISTNVPTAATTYCPMALVEALSASSVSLGWNYTVAEAFQ